MRSDLHGECRERKEEESGEGWRARREGGLGRRDTIEGREGWRVKGMEVDKVQKIYRGVGQ